MNEFAEYEGKNVDKALENASKALGKPIGSLQYDVVSYGSTGIFGFVGVKKAKIRIKIDSIDGGENRQQEVQNTAREIVDEAFENETVDPPRDVEGPARVGKEALQQVVERICDGATIETQKDNGRLLYNIKGGNSALLIGKRGQTLEAMQYLIEKIVNRNNDGRVRVQVDVEGYLHARKSNLQKMASKMAEKAHKLKKPVTIGQMNAYDRRIVHLHLKDNQAVRTQSVGEGYYRKLVVFPKRKRRGKV